MLLSPGKMYIFIHLYYYSPEIQQWGFMAGKQDAYTFRNTPLSVRNAVLQPPFFRGNSLIYCI